MGTISWAIKAGLTKPARKYILGPVIDICREVMVELGGERARRRRKIRRLASTMLNEFSRLGFTKKITFKRGKSKRQRVKFEYPLLLTHDELWCPINLSKLPTGVRTDDLRDESVLHSMEDRLDAAVRVDYLATGKLCYVIRLGGNLFPAKFSINEFEMPQDAPPLAIPFGVDREGKQRWFDLLEMKHLLVAGSTGGGKTTFMHSMLSTLINRNGVDDLELWLIDLKRTEFNLYKPLLSKKKKDGIVRFLAVDPEDAIDVLDKAYREIVRRNQLMEQHNATNIPDLASSTGIRLKRIVLAIDEFAQLTLDPNRLGNKQSVGRAATNLIARIAALGRSAGVVLVIGTQMINKEVISGLIKANLEQRLCFSTADWRQSQLVVETSEADGLPPGRAVLRVQGKTTELQTCLISARQVRIEVDRISEFGPDGVWGEDQELTAFVRDAKLIVTVSSQQFQGDCARSKIVGAEGVRGVMTHERFNEVAQRLERDGILEPGGARKPRRVARGYFNRPGLLDMVYGLLSDPNSEQTEEEDTTTAETNDTVDAHHNEANTTCDTGDDTVYGSTETAVLPEIIGNTNVETFLQQLDDTPAPVATKKRKVRCTFEPEHLDAMHCAASYTEVKDKIRDLKFHSETVHVATLANALADTIRDQAIEADLIVPVPLHKKRCDERGFNQAELLAHEVAERTGITVNTDLHRNRWTVPQVQLREAHRANNVADAFEWSGFSLEGQTVIILDDVISTGATVDVCAQTLKQAGAARVIALACANSGD